VYEALLAPVAEEFDLGLPVVPEDREPAYHMFYVLLQDQPTRDAVIETMRRHDVQPAFHYVPLHSAPAAAKFAARPTECPVTDDISGRLLRLPFHNNLSIEQAERVVDVFRDALVAARAQTAS
jgi:dTDP-4-amino-4,6-dideoxygalactose transaminase